VAQSRPRLARWQNGHAAACKAAYSGSIPLLASIAFEQHFRLQCSQLLHAFHYGEKMAARSANALGRATKQ
jgi:hypothetical protein